MARNARIAEFVAPLKVEPGSRVVLAKRFDPASKAGIESKKKGRQFLAQGIELLAEYQARLAAQDTYGVLVVLQALDAGGKDGTIRHVMSGVNPQGVAVHSFKVPSAEELDHDYLWRYARRLPGRGEIGIFNRSHYEEVLVVRVHQQLLERQKLPRAARAQGRLEAPLPGDQRLGALPLRQRLPDREAVPQPVKEEQRIRFLRGSTCPTTTGSSRRPTSRSATTGTITSGRSPRCSRARAPRGPPGTSSPPTASGMPASPRQP